MLEIAIPGHGELKLERLICDYNGTLACDGVLIPELAPLLGALSAQLEIHVVTADTFGLAKKQLAELPVQLTVLPADRQDERKQEYVRGLGAKSAVCLGNGRNDLLMLRDAGLGICLVEGEGCSVATLQAADVACRSAREALELLLHRKRLVATLRR